MSIATETASEYYELASKAADRGDVREALHYSERANDLLLRDGMRSAHVGCLAMEGDLDALPETVV
jgi:hypothetical protein